LAASLRRSQLLLKIARTGDRNLRHRHLGPPEADGSG
jgi:hypothetical protein